MTQPAISNLQPEQALEQAVKASQLLLDALLKMQEDDEITPEKAEKLARIRDQLIQQTFKYTWSQERVKQHQSTFQQLEKLDSELNTQLAELRSSLHKKRADNQHNRKAVHAYGKAKSQYSR